MKKFLFLIALFTLMGGANSVKAIVLGDEITSLDGITDGTKFIISDDGTKANYFWGNGTPDSGENEIKNANVGAVPADAYFYFTLEKYTDGDIPNTTSPADNIYRIKITNADGDGYPYGSNGYYLNAILDINALVISGPEAGWHYSGNEKKDALWYVTYDGEKGFSFQNVYRSEHSLSSWLAIGNNFETDQQYLKLYSKPVDPLAPQKAALSAKIDRARMYNALAYTDASFSALTGEITTAEAALDAAASAESLTIATANLQARIDALVLKEGYSDLTSDMFKLWNGGTADAIETGTAGCAYKKYESSDMPYGDGSVSYNKYANLSSYERLVLVVNTGGTPRFLLNRDVDGGSWNATEANSHLIDNTAGNSESWHAKYFSSVTQDGVKIWTVDLAQLVTDKGFAHLHSIKSSGGNVTVSGMYLYKAPDPLAEFKEALSEKIDEANKKSNVGKTTESYTALTNAKNDAITALNDAGATEESLTEAKDNLQDAIDGLKLAAGYANLTAEMFMEHNSVEDATVKAKAGCGYVVNTSTDQPYGDASVGEKKWADLTPYAELIINTVGTIKPRLCMNRSEADGQQAETQVASKMIDINPNNSYTWSTTKYQTIEGNKYTINLESIVEDYGFARLHAIKKQGYGDGVYVTDMLVYAAKSKAVVGEAGYATFSSIMNVDMTGVNAYSAKYNGEEVVLSSVTAVPANTGVIIQAAANTYELTNIESADDIADNELKVSDGTVVGDGSTIYVLNKVADKVGFYLLKSGNKLAAGKAYLQIGGGSARAFIRISGMDVTGISTVKQAEGKKDDVIYNMNGQRVSNPTKGVFIKNGVKFLVD